MLGLLLAATTGTFTIYPGPAAGSPQIEAVTQRGPIYELIVNCGSGTAIVSYSPVDGMYCAPRGACGGDRAAIIDQSCAGGRGTGLK